MDKEDNEIGRDLREAVANFRRALNRGDIDEVDETQTKTAALLQEMLEIIADSYRLSRDEMCLTPARVSDDENSRPLPALNRRGPVNYRWFQTRSFSPDMLHLPALNRRGPVNYRAQQYHFGNET